MGWGLLLFLAYLRIIFWPFRLILLYFLLGFYFLFLIRYKPGLCFFRSCISKGVCGRDVINAWDDIKSSFLPPFSKLGLRSDGDLSLSCLSAFCYLVGVFRISSWHKYHH